MLGRQHSPLQMMRQRPFHAGGGGFRGRSVFHGRLGGDPLAAKRLTPQTSVEYGRTKPYQPTQLPRSSGSVINRGDSAFVTALSALSSTSNVSSTSTTPLDIVLVLDASGSMDDPMNRNDNTKRIDALKKAANDFVTTIAEQNQGISDSSKQHQVSIVKFSGDKSAVVGNDTYTKGGYTYNYSQVMKTMSPCTGCGRIHEHH